MSLVSTPIKASLQDSPIAPPAPKRLRLHAVSEYMDQTRANASEVLSAIEAVVVPEDEQLVKVAAKLAARKEALANLEGAEAKVVKARIELGEAVKVAGNHAARREALANLEGAEAKVVKAIIEIDEAEPKLAEAVESRSVEDAVTEPEDD